MSHDRVFLNNVVTQTIVSEPHGHWQEYAGGYDDWLLQSTVGNSNNALQPGAKTPARTKPSTSEPPEKAAGKRSAVNRSSRISPWEEKELESIPEEIAALEARQAELGEALSDPKTYEDTPEVAIRINDEISEIEKRLTALFERWEALESKKTNTEP
ncbi:MAG: hypothetical protein H5U29_08175 [Pusillimonas sp.]|nr:hypothetical protein [Pusillimonas sp.]